MKYINLPVKVQVIPGWVGAQPNAIQNADRPPILTPGRTFAPVGSAVHIAASNCSESGNGILNVPLTGDVFICVGDGSPGVSYTFMGSMSAFSHIENEAAKQAILESIATYLASVSAGPIHQGGFVTIPGCVIEGNSYDVGISMEELLRQGLAAQVTRAAQAASTGLKLQPLAMAGAYPDASLPVEHEPGALGHASWTIQLKMDTSGVRGRNLAVEAAADATAIEDARAFDMSLGRALNDVSLGKAGALTNAAGASRPPSTYSPDLSVEVWTQMEAWWTDRAAKKEQLRAIDQPASSKLASQYANRSAADQGLSFDEWFIKTQRGGNSTGITVPDGGTDSWWRTALGALGGAAASAFKWAGDSTVDLAKSWGPLGTVAAVTGIGAATSGTFGKWTPWIIGGIVLLVIAR